MRAAVRRRPRPETLPVPAVEWVVVARLGRVFGGKWQRIPTHLDQRCTDTGRVEAVIDEERTSPVLAEGLGGDPLLSATAGDAVYVHRGRRPRWLSQRLGRPGERPFAGSVRCRG